MAKKKKKKAKAAGAAKKKSSAKSKDMLLVGTKTKEALKVHDLNVSSDALEGLNEMVYWYIEQAANRTIANGRKTVRAHDFIAK